MSDAWEPPAIASWRFPALMASWSPTRRPFDRMGLSFDAAMLANPAFPTSRLLARQTLLDYLQACAWVIVDERGNRPDVRRRINGDHDR